MLNNLVHFISLYVVCHGINFTLTAISTHHQIQLSYVETSCLLLSLFRWTCRPGRGNERLINGAKPSAIRATVCGITISRWVIQAHLSLGTLDIGEATAEFWTGTDARAVSYELADLPEGIWDASLVWVWALDNELATANGIHSCFGAFLSRQTLDFRRTSCRAIFPETREECLPAISVHPRIFWRRRSPRYLYIRIAEWGFHRCQSDGGVKRAELICSGGESLMVYYLPRVALPGISPEGTGIVDHGSMRGSTGPRQEGGRMSS